MDTMQTILSCFRKVPCGMCWLAVARAPNPCDPYATFLCNECALSLSGDAEILLHTKISDNTDAIYGVHIRWIYNLLMFSSGFRVLPVDIKREIFFSFDNRAFLGLLINEEYNGDPVLDQLLPFHMFILHMEKDEDDIIIRTRTSHEGWGCLRYAA